MIQVFKNIKSLVLILVLLSFVSVAFAKKPPKPPTPGTNPYCCAPPFLWGIVKPNIVVMLQLNESMYRRASASVNNGQYDSTRYYYGYFNPDNFYGPTGGQGFELGDQISGNILNWAMMSRLDCARRALFAGKGEPSSQIVKNKLHAEGGPDGLINSAWPCTLIYMGTVPPCTVVFSKPSLTQIKLEFKGGSIGGLLDFTEQTTIRYDTDPDPYNDDHRGITHIFGDRNDDNKWDEDAPRMGLIFFSDDWGEKVMKDVIESEQAPSIEDFVNKINNNAPAGQFANPGRAIFEAIHYLKYTSSPHFDNQNYDYHGPGTKWDPWYTYKSPEPVYCRECFLILLGDGEAHADHPSVGGCGHLPAGPFPRPFYDYDNDGNASDNVNAADPTGMHNPADDYALYGHVTDLRDDLQDINNINVYTLLAFGSNDALYKDIAKNGGFKDLNGDNMPGPSQAEWDKNADGIPDNFFMASDGYELEQAMAQILASILTKVNSGSGVAVMTTGYKGGGSTVQSQFYPRKNFPTGETVNWTGNTHSLWLDPYGWIREDTEKDASLHLQNDYVISMEWEPSLQNVIITRLRDQNGTGDPSQFDTVETVAIEQLQPVWEAGTWLWNADAGDRNITAFVDANWNGLVEAGEMRDFVPANAALLKSYLGVATVDAADTTIQYVRGTDFPNLRTRMADGKVWKLGDIISSGAVAVQPAIERYDFIYGDESYVAYLDSCRNRMGVVYTGANDGMLHCFNSGKRVDLPERVKPFQLDPAGYALGEELWAVIPFNLLPHLKWLQDPEYCHVYYVDLKPYMTDAQVFADDGTHPNGWGTILIGGMKIGGLPIKNDIDTCKSAYFAIDVTDPESPRYLWEFTERDLNLTVCYPTVIKVKDSWYLVFGSGPETCSGECAAGVRANVYVLDLATGTLLKKWEFPDDKSFIADIFGVDWGMDYTVDRIYFGDCIYDITKPSNWGGKIYRIDTNDETDPNNWDTSFVFDMERPITAEGTVATDDYNHLWVYFGSGRFFSEADETDLTTQRYIGIREDTTRAATVAGLYDATGVAVDTNNVVHYPGGSTSSFDALIEMVNDHGGWWRGLTGLGERNVSSSLVFGGAVLFTTYLPETDICSYGGQGRLYALFYRTGTAHINPEFLIAEDTLYHPTYLDVGQGMPSEPSLYVTGDQIKVFIQAAGGIVSPETGIPGLPKSGVIMWKGR